MIVKGGHINITEALSLFLNSSSSNNIENCNIQKLITLYVIFHRDDASSLAYAGELYGTQQHHPSVQENGGVVFIYIQNASGSKPASYHRFPRVIDFAWLLLCSEKENCIYAEAAAIAELSSSSFVFLLLLLANNEKGSI